MSPIFDSAIADRIGRTQTVLAAVAADPLPSRQADREHIDSAIEASKAEHDGQLCIAWVREHITRDVWPPMIGAAINAAAHGMEWRGRATVSGGPSGNENKLVRIWEPRAAA